jgi:hypothetical protein
MKSVLSICLCNIICLDFCLRLCVNIVEVLWCYCKLMPSYTLCPNSVALSILLIRTVIYDHTTILVDIDLVLSTLATNLFIEPISKPYPSIVSCVLLCYLLNSIRWVLAHHIKSFIWVCIEILKCFPEVKKFISVSCLRLLSLAYCVKLILSLCLVHTLKSTLRWISNILFVYAL